jgi:AraC family transcriptional regulator, transcriptional activator FtrA
MSQRRTIGHGVAALAYPGMAGLELAIVSEVFGLARPELAVPWWYTLTACAERPTVPMLGGASLTVRAGLESLAFADTVIVPGIADVRADVSPQVVAALRAAHERGARVVSICSGAFALAAAGLLDGRRATTHWRYADLLANRFPLVEVDPGVLYVDGDDVMTGAGSAAGLDLCLHLVRKDHGAVVANMVARRLVVSPHRDGGQAQYVQAAVREVPDDDAVAASMRWALEHLRESLTVDRLAQQAAMSTRSYLRHFAKATGTSPIRWLISQRVQASLPLLERTARSVEQIASDVGFETAVTYRHHFSRLMRTSPTAYRRTFRVVPASPLDVAGLAMT